LGDQDWIKFHAEAGITYTLHTFGLGESSDTYLYLYGTDGVTLLASSDDYGGTLASQIRWRAPINGTYYVLIQHWNPNIGGCGTGYTFTLAKQVQAGFMATPTSGAAPLQVAFTNSSTGNYSASLWNFGDGITDTLQSPIHIYTAPGVYTVTLTVSGLGGTDTFVRPSYITAYPSVVVPENSIYLPFVNLSFNSSPP
jgi:PKD repeat protein